MLQSRWFDLVGPRGTCSVMGVSLSLSYGLGLTGYQLSYGRGRTSVMRECPRVREHMFVVLSDGRTVVM